MNDLVIRAPAPAELQRVLHLFGTVMVPANARLLVAVRSQPVVRFVAALAGWVEGEYGRFHLAHLPGVQPDTVASPLIQEAASTARAAGLRKLLYGRLLPEDDAHYRLLTALGFRTMRSERFFHLAATLADERVLQMLEKYRDLIPANWRTEPIRQHSHERVLELIAPYRLMAPEELQFYWRPGVPNGFDLDLSSILFEGERVFGTLLARRLGETLYYDIRVVFHPHPRMRALANLCLFRHCQQHYKPERPIHWLQFRGGEQEHKETANLAARMGGTELPPRHVLAMDL